MNNYPYYIFWHKEDDDTYSKIRVKWNSGFTIRQITVIESDVSEADYFKRTLAGTLNESTNIT